MIIPEEGRLMTAFFHLESYLWDMKELGDILRRKGYRKIAFKVTRTQHLSIKASINGVRGTFILDTGASNSCVGFESVGKFLLTASKSKTTAAGAGAVGMMTQIALSNTLKMGRWKSNDFHLVVFDMSHVNTALREHKSKRVDGIIGADVLLQGEAIIDYVGNCLYLK